MLDQFSQAELEMFSRDFMGIIHICRKLNANVWRDEQGVRYNIDLLKAHITKFSAKYAALRIILEQTEYYEVKPVILLKDEKDFFNVFAVAGRMSGIIESVSIFLEGKFKTVSHGVFEKDFDKLKPFLKRGNVYFNITSFQHKRLHLRYREKYGLIELILDSLDFTINDPEFRLCAYYALSNSHGSEELEDIDKLFIGPVSTDKSFTGSVGGSRD
jgi:hypothetical protein